MYNITIHKYEDNPDYDPEKVKQRNQWGMDRDPMISEKSIMTKSLEVDLTDEEFAAVKKAVLEVM